MFANVPQLYQLAVEQQIHVLMEFVNVELRTLVVILVKHVAQVLVSAELRQRALE